MSDLDFLKQAIDKSLENVQQGGFPVGAVVIKNNQVVGTGVSGDDIDYHHAEYLAIDDAFKNFGKPLEDCTLYTSMEPCLLCLSKCYWSGVNKLGINKIVYAISKKMLDKDYYECDIDNQELVKTFNEQIEYLHLQEMEEEALKIVRDWEKKNE
jgi:guanine deaminase